MELDKTAPNFFDRTEIYENVAIQVLYNTTTGAQSIAWTRDPKMIKGWEETAHEVNRA